MWKLLGVVCMLGGTAGVLYSWVLVQRENQKWLEAFLFFLKKTRHIMQTEKIQIIHYIPKYISQYISSQNKEEIALAQVLEEIIKRLSTNTYPNGQMVWEEVFKEEEQNLHLDREIFQIVVQAGNGLFGRSREENIGFLEKSITELQQQQVGLKEKNAQERKVWIPVGMLGMLMLVILFI